MRQNYDFGPLFGSTVGFDRVFELVQNATRGEQQGDKCPLYDIERTGEDAYRITLAVAGFREDELTVTAERNLLFIEGEHREKASGPEREFLHRGIGARAFKQRFQLADHVKVSAPLRRSALWAERSASRPGLTAFAAPHRSGPGSRRDKVGPQGTYFAASVATA